MHICLINTSYHFTFLHFLGQENALAFRGDEYFTNVTNLVWPGQKGFYSKKGMFVQEANGHQGYFECKIKSAKRVCFPFSRGLQNICLFFQGDLRSLGNAFEEEVYRKACSWSPYLPYEPPHANDPGHRPHPVCWGCSPTNPWIDESPTVCVGDRIGLLVDCTNAPTFTLVVNGIAMQTYLMGQACLNKNIYPCIKSNSGCDFEVIEEPEVPERLPNIYEPQLWEWRYPRVTRRPQDP